jgi:branched-subunit amino acid transport protein
VRLWLSVAAVTFRTWVMKASGPLALGDRQLPPTAVKVSTLMAPVLLAGLIVADLGGAGWSDLDWKQVAGVGTAGIARTLKAPLLPAVVVGIVATALLRLLLN